jgi:T5SS/PEP-CTERM-associated repeat protein
MKTKDGRFAAKGFVAQFAGRCCCCLLQQQLAPQLTTFRRIPRILALLAALTTLGADPAQAQISTEGTVTNNNAAVPPGPQTNPFKPLSLKVGDPAFGSLTITSGGTVNNIGIGYISYTANAAGSFVNVSGPNSIWTNTQGPYVGYFTGGSLFIGSGGVVTDDHFGDIGFLAGSFGVVQVVGGTWNNGTGTNTGTVIVGLGGIGDLFILNGGTVTDTSGVIGRDPLSSGTVTVDGAGSIWTTKSKPQRFIKSGCKKAQKQIFNGWIGIEG